MGMISAFAEFLVLVEQIFMISALGLAPLTSLVSGDENTQRKLFSA